MFTYCIKWLVEIVTMFVLGLLRSRCGALQESPVYKLIFNEAEKTHRYGWRQISVESLPLTVLKKEDLTFRHIVKRRFSLPVTEAKLKLPF